MIARLVISNFLSIGEIEVDLRDLRVVGVVGSYAGCVGYSTGAGKSALVESIRFAITGEHRYGTDAEVIRLSADVCTVALDLICGDDLLTIERIVKRKGNGGTVSTAKVIFNGEIVARSTKQADEWLGSYLKVSPRDFLQSFFFRQKEYDRFLRDRAGLRLKFLEEFFDATLFDAAKQRARERRTDLLQTETGLEATLRSLQATETSDSAEELTARRTDLTGTLADLRADKKLAASRVAAQQKAITAQRETVAVHKQQLDEIATLDKDMQALKAAGKVTAADIEKMKTAISDLNLQIADSEGALKHAAEWVAADEAKLTGLQAEVVDALKKRSSLAGEYAVHARTELPEEAAACPTCSRLVDHALADTLRKQRNDTLAILKEQIANIDEHVAATKKEVDGLLRRRTAADAIRERRNAIATLRVKLQGREDMLVAFVDTYKKQRAQYSDMAQRREQLDTDASKLQSVIASLKKSEAVLLSLETKVEEVDTDIATAQRQLGNVEAALEAAQQRESQVTEITESLRKARCERGDLDALCDIFDRCRGEVVAVGLQSVQVQATSIISKIGATDKSIHFDTQRTTQKGDVVDSLDIYLEDSKGRRAVDGLSGGEWDLTAFAIRAALSRHKLQQLSSRVDFLILDEIFGALDAGSREELAAVISEMRKDFEQVFVISHTDIKDLFDDTLRVEMGKDSVSRLKL